MENKIQTLTQKITKHFQFKSIYLNEFIVFNDKSINIMISTNDDVNYMIFVFVDYSDLDAVCTDIQIALATKLKTLMNDESDTRLSSVNLSLNKNSTLIISTIVPNVVEPKTLNQLIASIEEEPYYYKKQVLTYKKSDGAFIEELLLDNVEPVITCEKIISNIDDYVLFTSALGNGKYKFCAMLYEKLPFLTLTVNTEKHLKLQDMINEKFTPEQLANVDVYRNLTSDALINQWIETIGVENDQTG
jgi:hypothetical protein